jgi:TetR/AcrR family transcriptional regulator, fatty acid metabolism regulator protein
MAGQGGRTFIAVARRRQIVECAVEAIAALGYAEASLARIAERAGISKGVISYHFRCKEELIREVVTHVFEAGGAFMLPRILAQSGATEMLRAYIESNLAFMRANRTAVLALAEILGNARTPDGRPLFALSEYEPVVASLEELLRRGQQAGELRACNPRVLAITIRAAIDAVPAQLAADPDLDVEAYARELATVFELATRATRDAQKEP